MKARLGDGSVFLEGLEYFVGKAGTATPTAWGDKKSHAGPGKRSCLDVWDVLAAPKLAIRPLRGCGTGDRVRW